MHSVQSHSTATTALYSRGLMAVLAAQFLSAFADNALLFGALALLHSEQYPAWSAPLLQEFFVGAYILLAPFVGVFADAKPKGQVMLMANGLKLLGATGMCLGLNPFVAYGLVGAGAAAYSPAKYGILSELTSPANLVKANGLMEASTIAAILLGAIAGGVLSDWSIERGLMVVAGCYCLAVLMNFAIPTTCPEKVVERLSLLAILRNFIKALRTIFAIDDARFAIMGTGLFWGAGSTLRFLLIAWVPVGLGISTHKMPAYLTAMVAVGIVVGAAAAARFVNLKTINRAMPAGVLIGLAVVQLSTVHDLTQAFALMGAVGACGGFFVVPLNALLQQKGHLSIGVGLAIAIQNLIENVLMLGLVALYSFLIYRGLAVTHVAVYFGSFLGLSLGAVWVARLRLQRKRRCECLKTL